MEQKIYLELTPDLASKMKELDKWDVVQHVPSSHRGILDTTNPNYPAFVEALNADETLASVAQQIAGKTATHPLTMSEEDIEAFRQMFKEHDVEPESAAVVEIGPSATVTLPSNVDYVQKIVNVPDIPELIDVMRVGPGVPPAIFEIESAPSLKEKGIRTFVMAVDRDNISTGQRDQLERFIDVMDRHFSTTDQEAFVKAVGPDLVTMYQAAQEFVGLSSE